MKIRPPKIQTQIDSIPGLELVKIQQLADTISGQACAEVFYDNVFDDTKFHDMLKAKSGSLNTSQVNKVCEIEIDRDKKISENHFEIIIRKAGGQIIEKGENELGSAFISFFDPDREKILVRFT